MESTERLIDLLGEIWKAEQDNAKALAERVNGKYQLPPGAPLIIRNLAALLAELQKLSFYHGATSMASHLAASSPDTESSAN